MGQDKWNFYTIEVDGKCYAVVESTKERAKELLTHSLWIRQGEKEATISRMNIVVVEEA